MNDPASELVERAKRGDFTAASELITRTYEGVFAYLSRMSGSPEDGADLTQKTFCKVWNSLARYEGRSSFKTWVQSIAHHVYVDWRRKANRLDGQNDAWWENCVAEGPSPFESAVERDSAHRLYTAVEQLGEEQREVIHLHYYQGLTIQETADALAIATSTVKYRLRNALDLLQSRLAEPKIHA
jgi:RNA polymerase sigma-70 factor, ECF subfamily